MFHHVNVSSPFLATGSCEGDRQGRLGHSDDVMRLRQVTGGDRCGWRTRELDGDLALDLRTCTQGGPKAVWNACKSVKNVGQ